MIDIEKEKVAAKLKGSYIEFCRFFYQNLMNKSFEVRTPPGRESHIIIVARELTKILRCENEYQCLNINVSPGAFKTTMVCFWIAWCWAHYPDSNFIYVSYSKKLSVKATSLIKNIVSLPMYKYLFDFAIRSDSKAKEEFSNIKNGTVVAAGIEGTITGRDAGIPFIDRFGGALVIDDIIKIKDAASDAMRQRANDGYKETLVNRLRGSRTPIINICQRAHEDDTVAYIKSGKDIFSWKNLIMPSLDSSLNPLIPWVHSKEKLLKMQAETPYQFAAQHQQDPMPSGGGLFKEKDFVLLDDYPDFLYTFITADTAETDKSYNDATVFSFWGVYEIENMGEKSGEIGIHWIDCLETRIEPKDLESVCMDFVHESLRFKVKPQIIAIEKKSTGVTLLSTLKDKLRGIRIVDIKRDSSSGSKSSRFIEMQGPISRRLVSINTDAGHKKMCIDHMKKITANNTHRHDDIADTCVDAIQIAIIDKSLTYMHTNYTENKDLSTITQSVNKKLSAGLSNHARRSKKIF